MYSFGKIPPRSLDSFGVSGVLSDECTVFYDSLFTPIHIGKVSDLLSARIRDLKPNELRFRALLLYTILEVYRIQSKEKLEETSDLPLLEPIIVECGIDAEKIAVGVSFTLPKELAIEFSGLPEKILAHLNVTTPAQPFERLLCYLSKHAPKVIVKFDPSNFRVEVISLLGISGQIAEADLANHEILVVPILELKEAPKAKENVELGDLNYLGLLPEDKPGAEAKSVSGGEELAKIAGGNAFQVEAAVKVSGSKDEEDLDQLVKGSTSDQADQFEKKIGEKTDSDNSKRLVSGGEADDLENELTTLFGSDKGKEGEDKNKIAGQKDDNSFKTTVPGGPGKKSALSGIKDLFSFGKKKGEEEEEKTVFKADGSIVKGDEVDQSARFDQYKEKILELQAELEKARSGKRTSSESTSSSISDLFGMGKKKINSQSSSAESKNTAELSEDFEELDEEEDSGPRLFSKKKVVETEVSEEDDDDDSESALDTIKNWFKVPEKKVKVSPKKVAKSEDEDEDEDEDEEDDDAEINQIEKNLAALDEVLEEKSSENLAENNKIVKELGEEGLVRVVQKAEADMAEVRKEIKSERAQKWVDGLMSDLITEKSRLTDLAKKVNTQMRQKENEARSKEQVMKQELKKAFEQLRQKTNQLSRTKEQLNQANLIAEQHKSVAKSANEERQFKQKFQVIQKQYNASKEEAVKLTDKLLELRNQLAKAGASKTGAESQLQSAESKEKLDRALKEVEELKATNANLQGKVTDTKKGKTTEILGLDEMRQKLDMATKDKMTSKRRTDTLQAQADEAKREAEKFKRELEKAQAEIRKLKNTNKNEAVQAAKDASAAAVKKPPAAA